MSTTLPATDLPGAIPTLNGTGFMLEALDAFAREFVDCAAAHPGGESLDIGCAYGVATHAALARGARICASDLEPRHLDYVREHAPAGSGPRLRTVVGRLPDVDFPDAAFDAILASRVIHFLDGPEVPEAVGRMARWLRPGGRLFLVVDSPYMPSWSRIVPAYEAAKAAGDPWPGFIADFRPFVPAGRQGPPRLNALDPDILARECLRAGLEVERAGYFGMHRLGAAAQGREHAGCVARRP
jgi:SAM-dependent methyltransferase